jgi:hypothetical protein
VHRLLEAYRMNDFFGLEPAAHQCPPRVTDAISLLPRAERHVRDVRLALEGAVEAAYIGRSKSEAVEQLERVLKGVAYPDQFEKPSAAQRQAAKRFFDEMLQRLLPA